MHWFQSLLRSSRRLKSQISHGFLAPFEVAPDASPGVLQVWENVGIQVIMGLSTGIPMASFANIGEPECMLDNIGERYTMSSSSYPPTEPDAILGGLYSPHVPGKGMPIGRRILVIPGKGRERVELGGRV